MRGEESCAACAAKTLCAPGRGEEVEVADGGLQLKIGEEVELLVSDKSHHMAVLTMLVIPFATLACTLALLLAFSNIGEGWAVLISFGAMSLCYAVAALCKPRLSRELSFSLRQIRQ